LAEEEGAADTVLGGGRVGLWAAFRLGLKGCPAAFLFFFFLFLFLDFYFLDNFCKRASNQIKPNSKFL
jgi:hypothetical protein